MGRDRREKRGWSLTICVAVLRPLLTVLTRRSFHGAEHLPRGGFVFAANHISHADPLLFAHFVNDTVEFHAVRGTNPPVAHVARCDDGDNPQHQFRAAKLLAEAVGLSDIVGADG